MRLSSLNPSTQLVLTIIVPILCILVALLIVVPATSHLGTVGRDLQVTESTIKQKQANINRIVAISRGWKPELAVAKADDQEPIRFLRQLATVATDSGVKLTSVRETPPPPLPKESSSLPAGSSPTGSLTGNNTESSGRTANGAPLTGQRPIVPSTVREVTQQVVAEGNFNQILEFITRLERFSERILTVSQCRLDGGGRKYPQVRATFTLSRFVSTGATMPVPVGRR